MEKDERNTELLSQKKQIGAKPKTKYNSSLAHSQIHTLENINQNDAISSKTSSERRKKNYFQSFASSSHYDIDGNNENVQNMKFSNCQDYLNPKGKCMSDSSNRSCHSSSIKKSNLMSYFKLSDLVKKHPNEIVLTILDKRSGFLSLIKESSIKPNCLACMLIAFGKACTSSLVANINDLMKNVNSDSEFILLHLQRYLASLQKQKILGDVDLDSVYFLIVFLQKFQNILPSSSSEFIAILLPLLVSTCEKYLKVHKDLYHNISEMLKEMDEQNQFFLEHHTLYEVKKESKKEIMHLEDPPENFRSLPVLPTADDINLPCSFLRPNIVKGRYQSTEHYLDVQYRLLREDYIKPLRDGIFEYLNLKKNHKSFKCNDIRVYNDVYIVSEDFVNGDLLHQAQFTEKSFSKINWEHSKRFLTGNLLCLSADDFQTMLFASVVYKKPEDLKEGLLCIRFEEITEKVLNLSMSTRYVVIETGAHFEAYRHNLSALQQLNEELLPFKTYIIGAERNVSKPQYLQDTIKYDMRPLLLPLDTKCVTHGRHLYYDYPKNISNNAEFVTVLDDNCWPTVTQLNLDNSQYLALKAAITKELAIIQGPPGTGKTYIGLRIVQLLLYNLNVWFSSKENFIPILIVCYTNHALDQFLEGLLLFTRKLVRIGGRSSNEVISKFQLPELRRSFLKDGKFPRYISNNMYEKRDLMKIIKEKINKIAECIEASTGTVLSENILSKHIPPIQYKSLTEGNLKHKYKCQKNLEYAMYDWLQIHPNIQNPLLEDCKHKLENFHATFEADEDVEGEGEIDVEYIENQRNIDFYDFDDLSFQTKLRLNNDDNISLDETTESGNSEWKTQQSKKQRFEMLKFIKCCLAGHEKMDESDAVMVEHVWELNLKQRWMLYKYWLHKYIEEKRMESLFLQEELKTKLNEISEMRIEEDLFIIEEKFVVGMTTTGAAKYRHLVQRLNPAILIVEEAAEILESHIITSLAPNTQHMILIGDQQQLRPSPTVHMLAVKYGMNISLFERMIKNEFDYCRLTIQHRMRPDIAALIVPHIYTDLENHSIVTKFEDIKGVKKNVYFISHSFKESSENDSRSKVNEHEAEFLIQLCRYLILQGYDPSQITILTTYTGQLFVLKSLATDDVKKVRITVVDNFQGEENDIILISFVRSNDDGVIGFLKVSNRVCVALSRAKKGLYCIGNFELLAEKSTLWKNIVGTLIQREFIGPSIQLVCQNHPNMVTEIANAANFKKVPDGGCSLKCEYRLPCGHTCTLMCHPCDHELIKCHKPCIRECERGHKCEKKCFEKCYCKVFIDRKLERCGHIVKEHCGKPEEEILCKHLCIKNCDKGHPCPKMCFEDCGMCEVLIEITLKKCGHTINEKCGMPEVKMKCLKPCIKSCEKGHPCPKQCFDKCGFCKVLVDKTLELCGHTVQVPCGIKSSVSCYEPCDKSCDKGHRCPKKCYQLCGSCKVWVEKTVERCGHTVKTFCGIKENEIRCNSKCEKILHCLHQCQNTCSETCTEKCIQPCLKSCKMGHLCQKKCFEECGVCTYMVDKTLKKCGHTVKAPCGKNEVEIKCYFICKEKLPCSHNCTNRCGEPCVKSCKQLKEAKSPICEHSIEVSCYIADDHELLFKKCSENFFICSKQCDAVLACEHKCKGTCGRCKQGRLHVACDEPCNRILICGHKCKFSCSKICPPCQYPCINECMHLKCWKKCGEPCIKCRKKCEWNCSHDKCINSCSEICNREPCNEPCPKTLPCGHSCIGFCGETCPALCKVCDSIEENNIFLESKYDTRYVLLEDCRHVFDVHKLNQWMSGSLESNKRIFLKTCPTCNAVIRNNFRYNHIVKTCFKQLEKIKDVFRWNKEKNKEFQNSLLNKSITLISLSDFTSNNGLFKFLSSNTVHEIQELTVIENIISAVTSSSSLKGEDNILKCCPNLQVVGKLKEYKRITKMWMADFIFNSFQSVSEHQLLQLTYEFHRLKLIENLLKYSQFITLESCLTEYENCAQCLLNYTPFTDESKKEFSTALELLTSKLDVSDLPTSVELPPLKAMDMSANQWYECSRGHVYGVLKYIGPTEKGCYECNQNIENKPSLDHFKLTHISATKSYKNWQSRSNMDSQTGAEYKITKQQASSNKIKDKHQQTNSLLINSYLQEPDSWNRSDGVQKQHMGRIKKNYSQKNSLSNEDHSKFRELHQLNKSYFQKSANTMSANIGGIREYQKYQHQENSQLHQNSAYSSPSWSHWKKYVGIKKNQSDCQQNYLKKDILVMEGNREHHHRKTLTLYQDHAETDVSQPLWRSKNYSMYQSSLKTHTSALSPGRYSANKKTTNTNEDIGISAEGQGKSTVNSFVRTTKKPRENKRW